MSWILYLHVVTAVVICPQFHTVSGQQQYFRLEPHDTEVKVRDTAILKCEVNNQAGQVQWTKDGFALGFEREIPGFPRFTMLGDGANGSHHLRITNVTLRDDGEYQCQVGPSRFHKAIRANAKLSVLVPPSSIEIIDHARGAKISIREGEQVELQCVAKNAKPAASIMWYRNNIELKLDTREDSTSEQEILDGILLVKKYNTQSKISFRPTSLDDGVHYACSARHPALSAPERASVQLSVLYPPGPPYIDGYTEGEIVRMGQTLTLVCISRGGNPLAEINWYKNERKVDSSYTTSSRESRNELTFVADSSDNNAKFRCEATNIMSQEPLKTEVTLTVQFAPKEVHITGPTKARAGDTVTLHCSTSNSNPPAVVSWFKGSHLIRPFTNRTVEAPNGGWLTSSNLTIHIKNEDRDFMITCQAVNQYLGESKVNSHMFSIIKPPQTPVIWGFRPNIPSGQSMRITCMSSEGNPPATLSWYKGNKKLPSEYKAPEHQGSTTVSAELAVVANMSDNNAEYRCEATNNATSTPLTATVTFSVLFPPALVKIKKRPRRPKDGEKASLTCESSSSNPSAQLTWWHEGLRLPSFNNGTRDGLYGGQVAVNILELDITPEMDGAVYTCQATNEALRQSVHDAVTLDVMYKPQFVESSTTKREILEGDSSVIALSAKGNPPDITYHWTRGGKAIPSVQEAKETDRVVANGPLLNVSLIKRDDAGTYLCEAVNSEGSVVITIQIDVNYPPTIVELERWVMVDSGEDAHLECRVDGNPLEESMVSWERDGFEIASRTRRSFKNSHSYLVVIEVREEDTGSFDCVVDNDVGDPARSSVFLIVKHKPQIDTSPQIAKAASNKGATGRLTCRARGAPNVTFTWGREGSTINAVNKPEKYEQLYNQIDDITWESVLLVKNVDSRNYGNYECVARNEKGFSTHNVLLNVTSHPDPPFFIKVLNVTHDTVVLSWYPGFDGGLTQSYRIRYRQEGSQAYRYTDVHPPNATSYAVSGLGVGKEYSFNVLAFNILGNSNYTKETVKSRTSTEVPFPDRKRMMSEVLEGKGEIPRIVIISVSIVGSVLVILNVVLVFCFIKKKKKKNVKEAASDQGSSKSATMEMYAPSSYNETVTGETLSSISEKSESYSNNGSNEDYIVSKDDTAKHTATSTYLIDNMDNPVQYTYHPDHPPTSRQNTLSRRKTNNIYVETDTYTDALRRNAYNHTIGDKVTYSMTTPRPPSRAASTATDFYNIAPDSRYVPCPPPGFGPPVGNGSIHNIPPNIIPLTDRNGTIPRSLSSQNGPISGRISSQSNGPTSPIRSQTPALSTFNPNPSPTNMIDPVSLVEEHSYENEGHLV